MKNAKTLNRNERLLVKIEVRMGQSGKEASMWLHYALDVHHREASAVIYELAAHVERVCLEHKAKSAVLVSPLEKRITLAGLGMERLTDGGVGYLREAALRAGIEV